MFDSHLLIAYSEGGRVVGSVATYSCNAGYVLEDWSGRGTTITCLADGSWSSVFTINSHSCMVRQQFFRAICVGSG